jgi:hypothetical protein
MRSLVVPDGALLLDCDTKLSAAVLSEVAAYRSPQGRPVFGIERYVSIETIDLGRDIDPLEAQRILGAVPALGLIQHCLSAPAGQPTWTGSPARGAAAGAVAAQHADLVDYAADAMLGYDNEDCSGDAAGDIDAWCRAQSRPPLLYTGYAPGLTPQQLWERPMVHCYWGAPGAWSVAQCGVAMRQHYPGIVIGGVTFDWSLASADLLGRRVVLATAG